MKNKISSKKNVDSGFVKTCDELVKKECNEIFIGDNELGRHRRKVHLKGNEHICEVCGQGFKMKFYMKRHKRSVESFFI